MKILGDPVIEYSNGVLKVQGKEVKPNLRLFKDLASVSLDKSEAEKLGSKVAYYMFRDVFSCGDDKLRFDITVIPAAEIGREFVKTFGHYHPEAKNHLSYCEVYEVLLGEAHYMLQEQKNGKITRVVLAKAKKGDKIVIPPNVGHATINPGKEDLILSNIVYSDFHSEYGEYEDNCGAAFFELIDGSFQKNENYSDLPELEILKVSETFKRRIDSPKDILTLCRKNPKDFEYLSDPTKY